MAAAPFDLAQCSGHVFLICFFKLLCNLFSHWVFVCERCDSRGVGGNPIRQISQGPVSGQGALASHPSGDVPLGCRRAVFGCVTGVPRGACPEARTLTWVLPPHRILLLSFAPKEGWACVHGVSRVPIPRVCYALFYSCGCWGKCRIMDGF